METFVQCMQEVCPRLKRPTRRGSTYGYVQELLSSFFHSLISIKIDSVALDELISACCAEAKSTSLPLRCIRFATSSAQEEEERAVHLLKAKTFFLFLRSILMVPFVLSSELGHERRNGRAMHQETANMIC
jgi:hypothetical protein